MSYRPLVFAHRGASHQAPENTLAAFVLAQELGADGVELDVRRTSEHQTGQIFLPQINSMLLVGVLMLVVIFQTSDNLSHAYGLAVTGTMLVTTCLAYIVVRRMWKWGPLRTGLLIGPLVLIAAVTLPASSKTGAATQRAPSTASSSSMA